MKQIVKYLTISSLFYNCLLEGKHYDSCFESFHLTNPIIFSLAHIISVAWFPLVLQEGQTNHIGQCNSSRMVHFYLTGNKINVGLLCEKKTVFVTFV